MLPSILFHSFNSYLIGSDTWLWFERCRVSRQFALLTEHTVNWRTESVKSNDRALNTAMKLSRKRRMNFENLKLGIKDGLFEDMSFYLKFSVFLQRPWDRRNKIHSIAKRFMSLKYIEQGGKKPNSKIKTKGKQLN